MAVPNARRRRVAGARRDAVRPAIPTSTPTDIRGGDRGDQIVTVHVNIPGTLSASGESADQRAGESSESAAGCVVGFFDKVKDALGV